jgi:PBP1b-binding outer membrane lipoprotein LpoB
MSVKINNAVITVLAVSFMISGCSTNIQDAQPNRTSRREISEEPANRVLDRPSVQEFLSACDYLTRDLASSAMVQTAEKPVVIEIKPIEDRTGQALDLTIYPQTIREKLMSMGHGRITFRDEESRDEIVEERIGQSDEAIHVRKSESSDVTGRKISARPGGYKGPGGVGTPFVTRERKNEQVQKDQQADVSGKIADVDYFLKGFVYLQDERTAGRRVRGFRYYRFQFRLTNARSGLMVWEKAYDLKNEGRLRD